MRSLPSTSTAHHRRRRSGPSSPSPALLFLFFVLISSNCIGPVAAVRSRKLFDFLAPYATSPAEEGAASNMPSKTEGNATNNDSGVLKELKEKIKDQATEIEALKQQMKKAGVVPSSGSSATKKTSSSDAVSHGGHGGGDVSPEDVANYMSIPFYEQAFRRVTWLGIFLGSLALTALIMNGFEHTLAKNIELAYFVPMLAGHGGNTGGQTVGTILSALSVGAVSISDAPTVIRKEAMAGVLSGFLLSMALAPIAHYVMGISMPVSVVLLVSLPIVSTIASTLGSAIPFFCVMVGLDPGVVAAPAMTSFVDVAGLMSYFILANKVFAMFGLEL